MRTISTMSVLLLVFLLFASGTVHAQEDKTTEFTEITGKVVDSSNNPVEKFKVQMLVYDYTDGGFQKTPKTLATWNGEFTDGEFKFDVKEPIPFTDMTYITRTVSAEGYLEQNRNGGFVKLSSFTGKLGNIKLNRGIKIKGKVALPDGHADEKLIQPKVYLAKVMSSISPDWNNMFQAPCTVAEDGTFEKTVPENCKITVTCSADNAATSTHEFKIPKSKSENEEQDFGELKLKEGVVVSGVVLDRDGEPAEGQVVQFQQDVKNRNMVSSFVYGYAQTDSEGKFKLPPREGKGEVTLVESGRIGGEAIKVKGKVLMTKPIKLTIKEGQPAADLEIQEANAHKVHGFIQYEGVKPTVYVSYGRSNQSQVEVDADGKFEVEIVEGVTPWMVIQKWDGNDQMMARMSSNCRREFGKYFSSSISDENYYFQFKKVTSDVGPLEFKMVKRYRDDRSMVDRFVDWFYYGDE